MSDGVTDNVEDYASVLAAVNQQFRSGVPHNAALGLRVESIARASAVLRLPYRDDLVGNAETGVLHGGVITALVDAACGLATFMELRSAVAIATLDLRIDYLRPARPGHDVFSRAECIQAGRNVAFVRATAYDGSPEDLVALAAGAFMIAGRGTSVLGPVVAKEKP